MKPTNMSAKIKGDINKINNEITRLIIAYLYNSDKNEIQNLFVPVILGDKSFYHLRKIILTDKGEIKGVFTNSTSSYETSLEEVTSPLYQVLELIEQSGYLFDNDILVCCRCGSEIVETQGWKDANSLVVTDSDYSDNDDTWCAHCEDHLGLAIKGDFKKIMIKYFENELEASPLPDELLKLLQSSSKEDFIIKFKALDYDKQREIYMRWNDEFSEEELNE